MGNWARRLAKIFTPSHFCRHLKLMPTHFVRNKIAKEKPGPVVGPRAHHR